MKRMTLVLILLLLPLFTGTVFAGEEILLEEKLTNFQDFNLSIEEGVFTGFEEKELFASFGLTEKYEKFETRLGVNVDLSKEYYLDFSELAGEYNLDNYGLKWEMELEIGDSWYLGTEYHNKNL